jgi:hypothetical protein
MKKILFLIICTLTFYINSLLASEPDIYIKSPVQNNIETNKEYIIKHLQASEPLLPGKYQVKAKVKFKTESFYKIIKSRELEWKIINKNDWQQHQNNWVWLPTLYNNKPLQFKLIENSQLQAGKLYRHEEIWIDYQQLSEYNSCNLQAELNFIHKANDGTIETLKAITQPQTNKLYSIKKFNPTTAVWQEKGISYLTRRELGLAPDDNWRYIREDDTTVIQRRFHEKLNNINYIDFIFPNNLKIRGINLQFGLSDSHNIDELLEWHKLPNSISKNAAQQIIRINLKQLVQFQQNPELYLQEAIIFIEGNNIPNSQYKPIQQINLYSKYFALTHDVVTITKTIEADSRIRNYPSINKQRMIISLKALAQQTDNLYFKTGKLIFIPNNERKICGIKLEKIQRVSLTKSQRPTFLAKGRDWNKKLGGSFARVSSNNLTPWVDFQTFLPFSLLTNGWYVAEQSPNKNFEIVTINNAKVYSRNTLQQAEIMAKFANIKDKLRIKLLSLGKSAEKRILEIQYRLERNNDNIEVALIKPYRLKSHNNKLIFELPANEIPEIEISTKQDKHSRIKFTILGINEQNNNNNRHFFIPRKDMNLNESIDFPNQNIKIAAENYIDNWQFNKNYFGIQGGGSWLEINYKPNKPIPETQYFFMELLSAKQVKKIRLTLLDSLNNELTSISGYPNKAIKLPNNKSIEQIKIRLFFKQNANFNLKINGFYFFKPTMLRMLEAIHTPLPDWQKKALIVSDIQSSYKHLSTIGDDGSFQAIIWLPKNNQKAKNLLTWKTQIDNSLDKVQGINISYQLSAKDMSLVSIINTKSGSNHQYKLNIEKKTGKLFIPLPVGSESIAFNLETEDHNQKMINVEFLLELNGIGTKTIQSTLHENTQLTIGDTIFDLDEFDNQTIQRITTPFTPWINLGKLEITAPNKKRKYLEAGELLFKEILLEADNNE